MTSARPAPWMRAQLLRSERPVDRPLGAARDSPPGRRPGGARSRCAGSGRWARAQVGRRDAPKASERPNNSGSAWALTESRRCPPSRRQQRSDGRQTRFPLAAEPWGHSQARTRTDRQRVNTRRRGDVDALSIETTLEAGGSRVPRSPRAARAVEARPGSRGRAPRPSRRPARPVAARRRHTAPSSDRSPAPQTRHTRPSARQPTRRQRAP